MFPSGRKYTAQKTPPVAFIVRTAAVVVTVLVRVMRVMLLLRRRGGIDRVMLARPSF